MFRAQKIKRGPIALPPDSKRSKYANDIDNPSSPRPHMSQPADIRRNFTHKKQQQQSFVLKRMTQIDIGELLVKELYSQCDMSSHKLYGVNLFDTSHHVKQLNKTQQIYLRSCYLLLNWENVTTGQLQQHIDRLEIDQILPDNIRLQNGKIKFDKLNLSLELDLTKKDYCITSIRYQLKRVFGSSYNRSLTKIVDDLGSYHFDELVQQVDGNENLLAVRTNSFVYAITPQKKYKFEIDCQNIKWGSKNLYLLCNDGTVRIVNRQTICNATVNQLSLESQVLDLWTEGEFLINCGENMLLAAIEKKYISIRAIGEMATQISISMDEQEQICFTGGWSTTGQITLVAVTKHLDEINKSRLYDIVKY